MGYIERLLLLPKWCKGQLLCSLEFRLNLQEVLELVRRSEEEGGGFPVAGDELPHRADLGRVQLVVEQRRLLQPVAVVQLNRRRAWGKYRGGDD